MASTAASIHRTLNLIVPTATTLPPSLIDLATNLLAQSRAKVPSLKPDEEIARPFACCHIACERLKHRLALEIGKVGPPCGPRIYKKLYAFLDSSLAAEPSTPRTKRVQDVEVTPGYGRAGRLEVGGTPRSGRQGASAVKATPGSLGNRNRAAAEQDSGASNLPSFTMPLIRHVCEACKMPRAATHVYAGVESVYRALQSTAQRAERDGGTPSKRRRSNGGDAETVTHEVMPVPTDEQIPALIATVYLMTAQMMRGQAGAVASKLQQRKTQTAIEGFFAAQENAAVAINPDSLQKDIETYTQAATAQGWTDIEWYKNLHSINDTTTGATTGYDEDNGPATPRRQPAKTPLRRKEKHSQRKIGDEQENPAGLLPGLGTMFQPAVDWLSEERRAEFDAWKEDLLSEVAAVEARG
jgi:origin recognition complex subunit 6